MPATDTPNSVEGLLSQADSYLPGIEDVPQPQLLVIDEGILSEVTEGHAVVRESFFIPATQRWHKKLSLKKLETV